MPNLSYFVTFSSIIYPVFCWICVSHPFPFYSMPLFISFPLIRTFSLFPSFYPPLLHPKTLSTSTLYLYSLLSWVIYILSLLALKLLLFLWILKSWFFITSRNLLMISSEALVYNWWILILSSILNLTSAKFFFISTILGIN